MTILTYTWPRNSICLRPAPFDVDSLAQEIYHRVCRADFRTPGFCVINAGPTIGSQSLRHWMVSLKQGMAAIHEQRTGKTLIVQSAARFDQQQSTRPHLDGGPDESLLMLGYEPSPIDASIEIADYARAAYDLGISPRQFLARHNPLFEAGKEKLRAYTSQIPCYSKTDYQIICLNNSSADFSADQRLWQGVLHTATIPRPDDTKRRVVNSLLIASAVAGTQDAISSGEMEQFITTAVA